jgi:hypothetical protein
VGGWMGSWMDVWVDVWIVKSVGGCVCVDECVG